jgi:phage terminase large subunit-like protein
MGGAGGIGTGRHQRILSYSCGQSCHRQCLAELLEDTPGAPWKTSGKDSAETGIIQTWNADKLIAEINNGGELVEGLVRLYDPAVAYGAVRAAHPQVHAGRAGGRA